MGTELLTEIISPKIDIEVATRDCNMPPIDKVYAMDEDSFEKFINEWLYACRLDHYKNIQRIGGAGDKGRDIIATFDDGKLDYYQCKHYDNQLTPSDFDVEFGKLCYYIWKQEVLKPENYYVVASHDIGPKLTDLIQNHSKINREVIENWDKYCKKEITKTEEIPLSKELKEFIENFDFSIVQHIPIQKIIDEHIKTIYGKIRFGGVTFNVHHLNQPNEIDKDELPYVNALLEAYSDDCNFTIKEVNDLKQYENYYNHFQRQRKDYYSIETIRRFVRDTFINDKDFLTLKDEVYNGVIDIYEEDYQNGLRRLKEVLKQAANVNTNKSLLDSHLHLIGESERKGTCHLLVNDKKMRWTK